MKKMGFSDLLKEKKIEIIEVGLRDGLQNLDKIISTSNKLELAKLLVSSGIREMEVTSFVNPKRVPQMADAQELVQALDQWRKAEGVEVKMIGLIPNYKGAENAAKANIDLLTMPISVSEKHNIENVNKRIDESFNEMALIVKKLALPVKVGLATAFGSPYPNDPIVPEFVGSLAKRAIDTGASHVILSDTVGIGNPRFVAIILDAVLQYVKPNQLSLHFHNTLGMGLANVLVGLEYGIRRFESSIGALGGCPFAPGSAGNIATEDLNNMLTAMGYETNIELSLLRKVLDFLSSINFSLEGSSIAKYQGNIIQCN